MTREETYTLLHEMGIASPELLTEDQIKDYLRAYDNAQWEKAATELLEANKDNPAFLRKITHIANQMAIGNMTKAQAHQQLKKLGFRTKAEAA